MTEGLYYEYRDFGYKPEEIASALLSKTCMGTTWRYDPDFRLNVAVSIRKLQDDAKKGGCVERILFNVIQSITENSFIKGELA